MPEEILQSAAAVAEPVSAPDTSTATPTPVSDPTPGQSSIDYLREAVAKVPIPEEKAVEVAKPAEVVQAEVQKTPEQLAAEKTAAEAKPAEVKTEVVAENPLDKLGPLPAETLAAALKAKPELEAALVEAGINKETLFETSRMAAECGQFREIAGTPESAAFMKQGADHFFDIEDSVESLGTPEGFGNFISLVGRLSIVKDADGNPVKNADGSFKTDGTMENIFQGATTQTFLDMRKVAASVGGDMAEEVPGLLDRIDEIFGGMFSGKKTAAPGLPTDLSPDIKAKIERADKIERESMQRDQETRAQQEQIFEQKVLDNTVAGISQQLRATLDLTALNEKQKEKAATEIYTAFAEHLAANKGFKAQSRARYAMGMNDANMQKIVGLNVRELKAAYTTIVGKVLEGWGEKLVSAQSDKLSKIATQINADRPNSAGGTSTLQSNKGPKTDDEYYATAVQNIIEKHGGREPANMQRLIISEVLKLKHIA